MALFNDLPAMLTAADDWSGLEHYHAAVDALAVVDEPSWHERVTANFHAAAVEYRIFHQARPGGPDIMAAVDGIASACATIDEHLETLLSARISAPPNVPDRADVLLALYPAVLVTLLPEVGSFEWDEREPGQAPQRGEFRRRARRVRKTSEALGVSDLAQSTRLIDPAFDGLIARLATMYFEVKGEKPYVNSKGAGGPEGGYRSPFSAMVAAFWPALKSGLPPPGNDRIRGALLRVGSLD